ncbi:MAG: type II toxin-antitoxin system VapC family toxin [Rhodoglobus sp.]
MKAFVVDASAVGQGSPLIDEADALFAPELIDLEVANLLRKAVIRHERDAVEAASMLSAWAGNEVMRFSHTPYLHTIWSLRNNITAYDAAYVALAIHLGAPLLTADRKLAHAAQAYCEVIIVG